MANWWLTISRCSMAHRSHSEPRYALRISHLSQAIGSCQPNGFPDLYPERYRYRAGSGFFQITLGWGRLSFTQAKVIDVAWDIICARGGQALIAYISWHVFTNYVTTSMEIGPIAFSTYRTVFLRNESLVYAIYRLFRNFARRRQLHSRIAMAFMVITMIFILIFPSFSSAMTGYSASVKSYVRDNSNAETTLSNDNNNYMAFSSFKRILYVIHDGWRIGEDGNFVVPYHTPYETKFTDPVLFSSDYFDSQIARCTRSYQSIPEDSRCEDQIDVANYVQQYGFHGLANVPSTFRERTLDPPALNITAYYLPDDKLGANWTDPRTGLQPFRDFSNTLWAYQNVTYNIKTITEQLACQPVKGTLPSSNWPVVTHLTYIPDILLGLLLHPAQHHAHPMHHLVHWNFHHVYPSTHDHETTRPHTRRRRIQGRTRTRTCNHHATPRRGTLKRKRNPRPV
ncbi:hypothetical protein BKA63DRAFT_553768 [Paraphoma chrysanthemicola]|nr:hypothetical protein BKA63DRAFT_553768 [Paraphoma chrysanthemicola]